MNTLDLTLSISDKFSSNLLTPPIQVITFKFDSKWDNKRWITSCVWMANSRVGDKIKHEKPALVGMMGFFRNFKFSEKSSHNLVASYWGDDVDWATQTKAFYHCLYFRVWILETINPILFIWLKSKKISKIAINDYQSTY